MARDWVGGSGAVRGMESEKGAAAEEVRGEKTCDRLPVPRRAKNVIATE